MKIKEKYDGLDIRTKAWVLTMSFILFFILTLTIIVQYPLIFGVGLALFAFGISVWALHLNIVEILHDREKKKK
jgi:hypothetical protein